MGVVLYTAQIGLYSGSDALDITRMTGKGHALAFAPSWKILRRFQWSKRHADTMEDAETVMRYRDIAWNAYLDSFLEEMRKSYKEDLSSWESLLAQEERTLLCYCPNPERCHRTLIARDIFPKLGAVYGGEREYRP